MILVKQWIRETQVTLRLFCLIYVLVMPIASCKIYQKVTSSFLNDPSENMCVHAYSENNMRGRDWNFCLNPNDAPNLQEGYNQPWDNNIRSIKVPSGLKVTVCQHPTASSYGYCQSYFSDVNDVGYLLNNEVSYIKVQKFDLNNFSVLLVTDPQVGYCETSARGLRYGDPDHACDTNHSYETSKSRVRELAKAVRDLIKDLEAEGVSIAGVIINGDITNESRKDQLKDYINIFERGNGFNIYYGLGNHDYIDYNKYSGIACNTFLLECRWRYSLEFFKKRISSVNPVSRDYSSPNNFGPRTYYSGSFAYAWEIGDYYFIQLNNDPDWKMKSLGTFTNIRESWGWLESTLKSVSDNKKVIINLHTADGMVQNRWLKLEHNPHVRDATNYIRAIEESDIRYSIKFKELVSQYPNIVAIFAGHIHRNAGVVALKKEVQSGRSLNPFTEGSFKNSLRYLLTTSPSERNRNHIPIIYGGGSQYGLFSRIHFTKGHTSNMEVTTYTSHVESGYHKTYKKLINQDNIHFTKIFQIY